MKQYVGFTNVLIYADFPVISVGLEHILKRLNCKLIVKSNKFSHVMSLLSDTSKEFDVLIIDSNGNDWYTLQKIGIIKQVSYRKPFRVLALIEGQEQKQLYVAAGIEGVVKKQAGVQELVEAIEAVLLGKLYDGPQLVHPKATDGGYHWDSRIGYRRAELLSEREDQIIDLLVQGFSQREISEKLTLHIATIATYKKRALDKLGAKSIGELLFLGWK